MRIVGRRIGEEISVEIDANTNSEEEFWNLLSDEWQEMGMGEMHVIGNPPTAIKVHDAGSCGNAPQFGSPFCHLDEGILEGIIETKFGVTTTAVERICSGDGGSHCHFDIIFEQINT